MIARSAINGADHGSIVLDLKGAEKENLTVEDLLAGFRQGAGKELTNDRILLSAGRSGK